MCYPMDKRALKLEIAGDGPGGLPNAILVVRKGQRIRLSGLSRRPVVGLALRSLANCGGFVADFPQGAAPSWETMEIQ